MPCLEIEGFNPGEFFENYLSHTNPKSNNLFTQPQRKAKHFDIHSNDTKVWYETGKVGTNPIGKTNF